MDKSLIRRNLSIPEGVTAIPDGSWKRAAVLALFLPGQHGEEILFTRRTDNVLDHKGQVSFPGGAVEPEDSSLEETALREAREEIGIQTTDVEILGRSNDLFAVSGWWITPVVGWHAHRNGFKANPTEVSRIFSIPVDFLVDRANWEIRSYEKDGLVRTNVIFYRMYDNELLWGITAQIVHDLLHKLHLM